jgi:UDP-2,3-diacylglucosamine pyrophosphatase LpxH
MRYRQRQFMPDGEIARMLDALLAELDRSGDELELVFAGDVFDFDAPRVVGGESVFHDQPRDAEHALSTLEGILRDSDHFVAGVARVLAAGHTVVFISGNHDVQLTLPEVRDFLRQRLVQAVVDQHPADRPPLDEEQVREIGARVEFRAWFHKTADGIVVEHGNQYDPYCSYRYPMAPFGKEPTRIQPTMGSLATRLLVSRMGYFNPHVDDSFMLSVPGYIWHWLKYYAFSRRSLAVAWAVGATRMLRELVRIRTPEDKRRRRANLAAAARETRVSPRLVARHAKLFARPAEDRLNMVLRELWVDRVVLVFLVFLLGGLWALFAPGPLALWGFAPLAAMLAYEILVPKVPLSQHWASVARVARKVARVHGARAVVFGHTHHPEGEWNGATFYGNTGTWSPAFRDVECTLPLSAERPVVWLRRESLGAELYGGLYAWKDGGFEPRTTREPQRDAVRERGRRGGVLTPITVEP